MTCNVRVVRHELRRRPSPRYQFHGGWGVAGRECVHCPWGHDGKSQPALQSCDLAWHGWLAGRATSLCSLARSRKKYTTYCTSRPSASIMIMIMHTSPRKPLHPLTAENGQPPKSSYTPPPVSRPCLGPVSWTPSTAGADRRAPETHHPTGAGSCGESRQRQLCCWPRAVSQSVSQSIPNRSSPAAGQ